MNYHHADWHGNDDVMLHGIDFDEPACTDRTCTKDHYIVIPSALWNDYGFLFDRLSALGSRIELVKMPEADE